MEIIVMFLFHLSGQKLQKKGKKGSTGKVNSGSKMLWEEKLKGNKDHEFN